MNQLSINDSCPRSKHNQSPSPDLSDQYRWKTKQRITSPSRQNRVLAITRLDLHISNGCDAILVEQLLEFDEVGSYTNGPLGEEEEVDIVDTTWWVFQHNQDGARKLWHRLVLARKSKHAWHNLAGREGSDEGWKMLVRHEEKGHW
jgi:hypothetical protein